MSHVHHAHGCMCPAETHDYSRFLCTVLLAKQALSLEAADSGSSLKHLPETPLQLTTFFLQAYSASSSLLSPIVGKACNMLPCSQPCRQL